MLDFVLVLARILVDIPCVAVLEEQDDDNLCLDSRGVKRRYQCLSDLEKGQVRDVWQVFQGIVMQQNQVHEQAVQLNVELIRRVVRELDSGVAPESDEVERDDVQALLDELWTLVVRMPGESLGELVVFARALVSVA